METLRVEKRLIIPNLESFSLWQAGW